MGGNSLRNALDINVALFSQAQLPSYEESICFASVVDTDLNGDNVPCYRAIHWMMVHAAQSSRITVTAARFGASSGRVTCNESFALEIGA